MNNIYKKIIEYAGAGSMDKQAAVKLIGMIKTEETRLSDDIAIIGISLKFPGADTIEEYWENIENSVDCISNFPERRKKNIDRYMKNLVKQYGMDESLLTYQAGAYLHNIEDFDYKFFKLTPKEASLMNPAQRIFLQTAWEAIEDAGYGTNQLAGSKTGVYVGYSASPDYQRMIFDIAPSDMSISMVGNIAAMIPSRIAYLMDLKGPAMILDTACSSSLVAIDLACQAIKDRECDMAIAGGIRINLITMENDFMKIGAESSGSSTRSFDDNADGTVWGEGSAALILKPVSQAEKDGDHIYAVIKGIGINQDGTSIGITAPNSKAQAEVVSKAWENAGIHPETIAYIEAHGTATNLGDPLEIEGLKKAFLKHTEKKQFCAISTVKSNMGHLYECAGMAGIIKAVLALKHKKIPGGINFKKPNAKIDFNDSPVYVNTQTVDWVEQEYPRRCGVSSFGLSGTNCHIILEEYKSKETSNEVTNTINTEKPHILFLSAKSLYSLNKQVKRYYELLNTQEDIDLQSMCYAAAVGRGHYGYRLAIVFKDTVELIKLLRQSINSGHCYEKINHVFYDYHKITSGNKDKKDEHEITERDRMQVSSVANNVITAMCEENLWTSHQELASLYIRGADIPWRLLYKDKVLKKVRIPAYPFEPLRCWVDMPKEENPDKNLPIYENNKFLYQLNWEQKDLKPVPMQIALKGTILILAKEYDTYKEFIPYFKESQKEIVWIRPGTSYKKVNDREYIIKGDASGYSNLISDFKERNISLIIHAMGIEYTQSATSLSELKSMQTWGLYSLLRLVKALITIDLKHPVEIALLTKNAHQIKNSSEPVISENAMIHGLGKVINKEAGTIKCSFLDFDEATAMNTVVTELLRQKDIYELVAYRNGIRYTEIFDEIEEEGLLKNPLIVHEGNVYIITGGLGGIGLEIAKSLALKGKVHFILTGRSDLPERALWEPITSQEEGLQNKISALLWIETMGSSVDYYKADVTNMEEMLLVVNNTRNTYGKINGIFHCAGIATDAPLMDKSEDAFCEVVGPKVEGAWILDYITRNDNLDFFMMSSSVATIFSMQGQGDYVAANSYMDSFAKARSNQGKRTLTVNWTTWKETGMAYNSGFVVDTIFETLLSARGVQALEQLLGSEETCALVGKLNYEGIGLPLLERSGVGISDAIQTKINWYKRIQEEKKASAKNKLKASTKSLSSAKADTAYNNVEKIIADICRNVLGFEEIDIYDNFFELGADSILLTKIQSETEAALSIKLNAADMFEYTTVAKLAEYIIRLDKSLEDKEGSKENTVMFPQPKENNESSKDIAIIGIALNMPMADTLEQYWQNLKDGLDCISQPPKTRQEDVLRYARFIKVSPNDLEFNEGSFIDGADQFDYTYFRIPPKEAKLIDPNHRVFLETAYKTIEDAGYGGKKINGSNTGVYLGFASTQVYLQKLISDVEPFSEANAMIGNTAAVAAGRLSYSLDLKGPCMIVDTACSSSLVAVHTASKAILAGECDMAIAGGVRLCLAPVHQKGSPIGIGMESTDGRARTFDYNSDGTGSGEGVAALLLKPLKAAVADHDNIYAIIKGSAVNQDGSSAGITAPNPAAQEEVILKAWKDAGIDPLTIGYIETHGTGTPLGDPIEIQGIQRAFEQYTSRKQFCSVSSVKTNIAHLSEAAGIAGLIHAVNALKNKEIPPSKYFSRPNQKIDFANTPVYVNTIPRRWETDGHPRRCGISGFGMSGTNCHIILEEYKKAASVREDSKSQILTLSAKTVEVLKEQIKNHYEYFKHSDMLNLVDVCYTANTGKEAHPYRVAVIASNLEDMSYKLNKLMQDGLQSNEELQINYGYHKIISENKKSLEEGDITEARKRELKEQVDMLVQELETKAQDLDKTFSDLCLLYIQGADINWDIFYDENVNKVSLPAYPFERNRCWLDIPEAEETELDVITSNRYHRLVWIPVPFENINNKRTEGLTIIFKGTHFLCEEVTKKLKETSKVMEVELGSSFKRVSAMHYIIDGSQEDFTQLFEEMKTEKIDRILHMFTLEAANTINTFDSLKDTEQKGVYSLLRLSKAISKAGIKNNLDIALISMNIENVCKNDKVNPFHAPLFGLGKVVRIESTNQLCRGIDIDEVTSTNDIISEIMNKTDIFHVAHRGGLRYISEFQEYDPDYEPEEKLSIVQNHVYVVTGGTGGMAFEMALYLAGKANIKLALISRFHMPERSEWKELLKYSRDHKLLKNIKNILTLEALGAEVTYYSADVADYTLMSQVFKEIRNKYGTINGILHTAGLGGGGFIFQKEESEFSKVVNPKVHGTWILNHLTQDDNLDFFILCSSIATVFPGMGQGDYAAGNACLDSFCAYRSLKGEKAVTFNWVAWKDTGMAIEYGANVDDTFKALPTVKAMKAFDDILNKQINRVIIGELNYGSEKLAALNGTTQRLSKKIDNAVKQMLEKVKSRVEHLTNEFDIDVKLKGRDSQGYSEIESKLAMIYSQILGFEEIDIYDNFFELGGDSILLSRMFELIEIGFPGKLKLLDLFEYTSISKLAAAINQEDEAQNHVVIEDTNQELEDELANMLEQVKEGDLSIEAMLNNLSDL